MKAAVSQAIFGIQMNFVVEMTSVIGDNGTLVCEFNMTCGMV